MGTESSSALLLDLYELTMAQAYREESMASRQATFSLFVRALPSDWGYLVSAGLDDCLSWLENLHFSEADLAALAGLGVFTQDFLWWLAEFRFSGSVRAVPEGTIVFADEPLLEVRAPIAEAQLAESFLLNQITLQTSVATEAARCRHAARGRKIVDFSLRRAPGTDAGMKVARCSRLVGLDGTSNVAGALEYGLPGRGTMAHSFVQAHTEEIEAFRAYAHIFGPSTVLLVDTYDTEVGIERAIQVAHEMHERGVELQGIRLDSGDLGALAKHARLQLDEAGLPAVTIFASGGLDEYQIEDLVGRQQAPIDGFGVGAILGAGGAGPTVETVYKLVDFDGRPVRKTSAGKATWPGNKQVWRGPEWSHDLLTLGDAAAPDTSHRPLLEAVMEHGRRTEPGQRTLTQSNAWFEAQWESLPGETKKLRAPARYQVSPSEELLRLTGELDLLRQGAISP